MTTILNKLKRNAATLTISILFSVSAVNAQDIYKIEQTQDIDLMLSGTSTLHSWSMDAKTFEGEAQFEFESENSVLTGVKKLTFAVLVEDLRSDSKGLDKNAYKALKTSEYKDIHYKLQTAVVSPDGDGKYRVKAHGALTIAGVTKEVVMDVLCVVNKNGTVRCTGSDKLNMTDYNVKPPTFMLGAMKTGDEITIKFVMVYKKQKGI